MLLHQTYLCVLLKVELLLQQVNYHLLNLNVAERLVIRSVLQVNILVVLSLGIENLKAKALGNVIHRDLINLDQVNIQVLLQNFVELFLLHLVIKRAELGPVTSASEYSLKPGPAAVFCCQLFGSPLLHRDIVGALVELES